VVGPACTALVAALGTVQRRTVERIAQLLGESGVVTTDRVYEGYEFTNETEDDIDDTEHVRNLLARRAPSELARAKPEARRAQARSSLGRPLKSGRPTARSAAKGLTAPSTP
jgi:hypothetical protein